MLPSLKAARKSLFLSGNKHKRARFRFYFFNYFYTFALENEKQNGLSDKGTKTYVSNF